MMKLDLCRSLVVVQEHHSNARDSSQGNVVASQEDAAVHIEEEDDQYPVIPPSATKLANAPQQKYSNDLVNDLTENEAYDDQDEDEEDDTDNGHGTMSGGKSSAMMDEDEDEMGEDEELDSFFGQQNETEDNGGNYDGDYQDDEYDQDDSNYENGEQHSSSTATLDHHQQQHKVRSFQQQQQQLPHHHIPSANRQVRVAGHGGRSGRSGRSVANADNHYERQYACKRCEFFTNNPRAVLYHRKEVHREKINVYECNYCQYASQYTGKVERHVMLRHKLAIDLANKNDFSSVNSGLATGGGGNHGNGGATTVNPLTPATATLSSSSTATISSQPATVSSASDTVSTASTNNDSHSESAPSVKARLIRPAIGQQQKPSTPVHLKSELSARACQPAPGTTVVTAAASFSTSPFGITKFQCNKCPCTYKRASDLTKHLKTKHGIIANNSRSYLMQTGAIQTTTSSGMSGHGSEDAGCHDDENGGEYDENGDYDVDNELANSSSMK